MLLLQPIDASTRNRKVGAGQNLRFSGQCGKRIRKGLGFSATGVQSKQERERLRLRAVWGKGTVSKTWSLDTLRRADFKDHAKHWRALRQVWIRPAPGRCTRATKIRRILQADGLKLVPRGKLAIGATAAGVTSPPVAGRKSRIPPRHSTGRRRRESCRTNGRGRP